MSLKVLLLLVILAFVHSKTVSISACDCFEILTANECNSTNCEWDLATKKCEAYPAASCSIITGHQTCRTQANCAWFDGKCENFSDCTKYKNSINNVCTDINYSCTKNTTDDKCVKVKPSATCAERAATATECTWGSDGVCVLAGDPIKCIRFENCDQGNASAAQCDNNGSCEYVENKCIQKKCEHVKTQSECYFVPNFQFTQATICEWKDGKCQEGDVGDLTEQDCFSNTASSHVWRDNACRECEYGVLISMLFVLALIIGI